MHLDAGFFVDLHQSLYLSPGSGEGLGQACLAGFSWHCWKHVMVLGLVLKMRRDGRRYDGIIRHNADDNLPQSAPFIVNPDGVSLVRFGRLQFPNFGRKTSAPMMAATPATAAIFTKSLRLSIDASSRSDTLLVR